MPLLEALARFGGEGTGVTRRVYDDAWCDAHRWLANQARTLGLAATADAAGNLFFHDPSVRPGDLARPVILVGSHLDSVECGGRFDGALGVVAALLAAVEHRAARGLPVVGFVTCEEEGSRFQAGLMGVRSLLGQVGEAELDAVRDADGVTWREALARARAAGCAADGPLAPTFRAALMLELHIEQGPVLEAAGLAIGIVEHIAGYRRLRVSLTGEPRHSGTTPMARRRDALAAAAEIVLAAEALANAEGPPAVATAGRIAVTPGLHNVVPGTCALGLEVRHVDPERLEAMATGLGSLCAQIAARRNVRVSIEEPPGQGPTSLSPALADAAARLAQEMELPARRMASGAAHDTMVFARAGVPSLMVFVPSRDGVSHAPEEYTPPAQLEAGYRFLSRMVGWLSGPRA
jgi:allantoate deiminase